MFLDEFKKVDERKIDINELEIVLKDSNNYYEFCDNNCEHLDVNEREQNLYRLKCNHNCKKYNKKLLHLNFHPLILKCGECVNEI